MSSPNLARIASLASWTHFFHPTTGIFRLPSAAGDTIEHLDIDLRYVDHDHQHVFTESTGRGTGGELYLPNVCKVTLRGGEYVQDSEERMECLVEVLAALDPVEVLWLNAFDDPSEQQTLSTVLVHPAIITAGELWRSKGNLQKLVIQGGFPMPNLTAPTPFSITPAVTPAASPGPHQRSFFGAPGFPNTGLPSLSLIKPKKPVEEAKAKDRAERQRLAEYTLKPRWEFAFGTWGVSEIKWSFDGRFTNAAITQIASHLFEALADTFPSTSHKVHRDLPSLLTFAPIPVELFEPLSALPSDRLAEHLADAAFVSSDSASFARLFDAANGEPEEGYRATRRLRAEMMLLADGRAEVVHLDQLNTASSSPATAAAAAAAAAADGHLAAPTAQAGFTEASPAHSMGSLSLDTDVPSDDDDMAQTPPMADSMVIPPPATGPGALGMDLGKPKDGVAVHQRGMSEESL